MILPVEAWMDLRRYPLRAAGATWREIADEVGVDWRTVKKYLSTDAAGGPPTAPSRRGYVTHISRRYFVPVQQPASTPAVVLTVRSKLTGLPGARLSRRQRSGPAE